MSAGPAPGARPEAGAKPPPFADAPVFVAGASGYIGARLVPRLLDAGYSVRCLARTPQKLEPRTWARHPRVSIVQGDLASSENLAALMQGCGAAFYLVHSLLSSGEHDNARDAGLARRFVSAASEAGLARIIYLGGLRETGPRVAARLAGRSEVGRVLAAGDVPATVFRAAMILGSGSVSFEILRYLVQRQPIMLPPRWVKTAIQPIGVSNVLHYLVACLAEPRTVGQTLDIGGPDVLTYVDLLHTMAEELGLKRRFIFPLPVQARRLSTWWISFITPVSREMVRPLADGLANPVVCHDREAAALMPQRLLTARDAIASAVRQDQRSEVESAWSDAGTVPGDPEWAGGRVFMDRRQARVDASADAVFRAACRVGGHHGYYGAHWLRWLWALRGSLDELAGGPGLQRGRRDPNSLRYGDAVDFWRVTAVEPGRQLRLHAEMKVPGHALLEFAIDDAEGSADRRSPAGRRSCRLTQTATFLPRGLMGYAYWYSMLPFHFWIFTGMLRGIKDAAELDEASRGPGVETSPGDAPHDPASGTQNT
jgi:uncharacterized protein YbjT (DUF2867 family)